MLLVNKMPETDLENCISFFIFHLHTLLLNRKSQTNNILIHNLLCNSGRGYLICYYIFVEGNKSLHSPDDRNKSEYFQGQNHEEPIVRYGSFYLRLGAIGKIFFNCGFILLFQ